MVFTVNWAQIHGKPVAQLKGINSFVFLYYIEIQCTTKYNVVDPARVDPDPIPDPIFEETP